MTTENRPAAVLWDLDGTLVDSEPLHHRSIVGALDAHGIVADDTVHADMLGRSARACYTYCRDYLGLDSDYTTFIGRKYEAYLAAAAQLEPQPEAIAVYRALQARGTPQAVVSNSDRLLVDANLRAIGLTAPEMVTVSHNDVRTGKPSAEPYERAAWLLGVEPAGCVVIEDSPTGAEAGLAAGMTVLALTGHGTAANAFPAGVIPVASLTGRDATRVLGDVQSPA